MKKSIEINHHFVGINKMVDWVLQAK